MRQEDERTSVRVRRLMLIAGVMAVTALVDDIAGAHSAQYNGCACDCNGNEVVAVNEVTLAGQIFNGTAPLSSCPAADVDDNGQVTVGEVLLGQLFANQGCPDLPDMIADDEDLLDFEVHAVLMPTPIANMTALRIATGSANIGLGPLEIEEMGVEESDLVQRVYNSVGTPQSIPIVGNLGFHEGHQHLHFDDWIHLTLVNIFGVPINSTAGKLSFCLIDSEVYDAGLAGPQTYNDCESLLQGISSGWKDVYGKGLFGQFLDVTGLTIPGFYVVRATVDPLDGLVETDETNNVANRLVYLSGINRTVDCRPFDGSECCINLSGSQNFKQECIRCKDYFCLDDPNNVACGGQQSGCP